MPTERSSGAIIRIGRLGSGLSRWTAVPSDNTSRSNSNADQLCGVQREEIGPWVLGAQVLQELLTPTTRANFSQRCDLDSPNDGVHFRLGALHEGTLAPSTCPAKCVNGPTSDGWPSRIALSDRFEDASFFASPVTAFLGQSSQEMQVEGICFIQRFVAELHEHRVNDWRLIPEVPRPCRHKCASSRPKQ